MKKVCLLIMVMLTISMFMGCRRVDEDLSQDSVYKHMVGKVYRTKKEFLICYYKDKLPVWGEKKLVIEEIDRSNYPETEEEMKPFPFQYYGRMLLGLVPAGSEFKIVKVKQAGSTGMNFTGYKVEIMKSKEPQW